MILSNCRPETSLHRGTRRERGEAVNTAPLRLTVKESDYLRVILIRSDMGSREDEGERDDASLCIGNRSISSAKMFIS